MATLTITTTSQQDTRIVTAFGHYLGLPGNASAAQVNSANAGLTDLGAAT